MKNRMILLTVAAIFMMALSLLVACGSETSSAASGTAQSGSTLAAAASSASASSAGSDESPAASSTSSAASDENEAKPDANQDHAENAAADDEDWETVWSDVQGDAVHDADAHGGETSAASSDDTAYSDVQGASQDDSYPEANVPSNQDAGAVGGGGANASAQQEPAGRNGSSSGKTKSNNKGSNQGNAASSEGNRVWVEPVYEKRTVHPNTGTRYCGGANNGTEYGTCTESWHGTKEETYELWYAHWKAYVQRRMKEEAEKGKAYVCDHVHDDSKWVPDPDYVEEVLVSEGYWKEG